MKFGGVVVAAVIDGQPTDELNRIFDLADRAQEYWAEVAKMVQLCRDAGLGSWKELRGLKPRKLEEMTMVAVRVLASRERQKLAEEQRRLVPHIDEYRLAEAQRKAQVRFLFEQIDLLVPVAACELKDGGR